MTTKQTQSYAELATELDDIVLWFNGGDFDIDEAVAKYERGLELVQLLEQHLKTAENTVVQLKAKFASTS